MINWDNPTYWNIDNMSKNQFVIIRLKRYILKDNEITGLRQLISHKGRR